MTKRTNKIFDELIRKLDIQELSTEFEISKELQKLISGDIIESNDCITLSTFSVKPLFANDITDKIGVQDFNNHFHIQDYLREDERTDLRKMICAGLFVIKQLTDKFKNAKLSDVYISLSIETIELGQKLARHLNLLDDVHYNDCRLSFYMSKNDETVTSENLENYEFNGLLLVRI